MLQVMDFSSSIDDSIDDSLGRMGDDMALVASKLMGLLLPLH